MHAIDFQTGKAGMAYVGDTPWHGLGSRVDKDASIDEWRVAAGLDWSVKTTVPIYQADSSMNGLENRTINNRRVLYRSDTGHNLGYVSERYNIVQPDQVLEFYRGLIDEQGFKIHTAGSLCDGQRIWALAEVDDSLTLFGQDTVLPYLLLATSYDGTMATTARFTTVRVVCQNTLHMATENRAGSAGVVSIPHSTRFDEQAIKQELGLLGTSSWDLFKTQATELAQRTITHEEAVTFLMEMAGVKVHDGETLDEVIVKSRPFQKMAEVTQTGVGQNVRSAQRTAWGLVNGITRYVDHERRSRNQDTRMNSAWFGNGNALKQKAMKSALQLLEVAA